MSTKARPAFAQIWMCRLPESSGSVQRGYRPVMILSNDINNKYSPTVNVIPITSKLDQRRMPMHVPLLDHNRYGLSRPSVLLVEQITTVPMDALTFPIGEVSDAETLHGIFEAISVQFPVVAMFSAASASVYKICQAC